MKIEAEMLEKDGMYIFFNNGQILDLSKDRIQALGRAGGDGTDRRLESSGERTSIYRDFMGKCSKVNCSAVKPLLPILEELALVNAQDVVGAVYVNNRVAQYAPGVSLQQALKYLSDMSLFEYCSKARGYQKYFQGIDPFMGAKEAGARLFMNIYWLEGGEREKVDQTIKEIQRAILFSARCCSTRLDNVCRSDALMNAYVISQGALFTLSMDIEQILSEYFASSSSKPLPV